MLILITLSSAFVLLLPTIAEGTCPDDSLPCDDGQCVLRKDWCYGDAKCDDGSDEAYCGGSSWFGVSPNKCNKKIHFRCKDGLCWPLAARCDGTPDCEDSSDEDNCDSEGKNSDESEEKGIKNDDEEDESVESSEEGNAKSKESSEENGSDDVTTKIETPSETSSSDDFPDFDGNHFNPVEVSSETSTLKNISPPSGDDLSIPKEAISEVVISPPTTVMDYYAHKMNHQYSAETNIHPTRPYLPSPIRPVAHYQTSRKPAVPYTGPTRPYTPRPYRYIGARHFGQRPSQYRGRYQQPQYPPRVPYHSPNGNYISPQPRPNHRQPYRYPNDNNRQADWRNGFAFPQRVYGRRLRAPSRFYFNKNYNEIYGSTNDRSVRRGVEWILSIRNATGGWGKETPRALVALSLVNNSFLAGNYENDLMQKYFQVHLGMNLLREERVSLNRLSMFVNALIATCQDPRDFQGWDLTELIRNTIQQQPRRTFINPLVYLSLCLADMDLNRFEEQHLMTYLVDKKNDEVTRDMTCLALEAFSCHMQKQKHNVDRFPTLQKMVWNATSKILRRMKDDGSFGSVYSTAVAAKALLSVNETIEWDPELTFNFLKNHQQENGSFGDFLATYHVLPALSGRSLLHLRNTECNPPRVDRELSPQEILQHPGPKSYIRYSLHMGNPLATGYTVQLLVPTEINFFDVMRVAAYENSHFKFSYEEVNGKINVFSISDIPNDPEEGLAWRLYIRSPSDSGNIPIFQQQYVGDIRELLPRPDQHIIFWYHSTDF